MNKCNNGIIIESEGKNKKVNKVIMKLVKCQILIFQLDQINQVIKKVKIDLELDLI